jgi:hypothetical protein
MLPIFASLDMLALGPIRNAGDCPEMATQPWVWALWPVLALVFTMMEDYFGDNGDADDQEPLLPA